jgi:hypothetical protein
VKRFRLIRPHERNPGISRILLPVYALVSVGFSANLTDLQKMIAEYWSGNLDSEQSPAQWPRLAEFVSERDHQTLDEDVKTFFALSNAMLDADIAAWDAKRAYDSVRPITAISLLFNGKKIRSWSGGGKGTVEMDGSQWAAL